MRATSQSGVSSISIGEGGVLIAGHNMWEGRMGSVVSGRDWVRVYSPRDWKKFEVLVNMNGHGIYGTQSIWAARHDSE